MTVLGVLLVAGAWIVVSALTAVVCAAVLRGGVQEDRARGYLRTAGAADLARTSPCRIPLLMAESRT